jgi:hypothetical protein
LRVPALLGVGGALALIAAYLPFEFAYTTTPDFLLGTVAAPPFLYSLSQVPGFLAQYATADTTTWRIAYGAATLVAVFMVWVAPLIVLALAGWLILRRQTALGRGMRRLLWIVVALEWALLLFYFATLTLGRALDSGNQTMPLVGVWLLVLAYLLTTVGAAMIPVIPAAAVARSRS